MTHFAGKAAKVLFLSVVTTLLLAATALAADQAVAVGSTTGSSLRMRADASTSASIVSTLDKGVAMTAKSVISPPTIWPLTRTTCSLLAAR